MSDIDTVTVLQCANITHQNDAFGKLKYLKIVTELKRISLSFCLLTWQTSPLTFKPSALRASRACTTLSSFREEIQTFAPSSANLLAAAKPIPSVDAVTIAVLPFRF